MDNLTKGLTEEGHEVHVLCASTRRHPFRSEAMSDTYKRLTRVDSVFVDNRSNFVDAFSDLITRDSHNISRFFSPDLDMALERKLMEVDYDIVQLESLFMTPYIRTVRRFSKAKVVLRSHNMEFKIWQRSARKSASGPKRAYLKLLANRLKDYEMSVLEQVDAVVTISPMDTDSYRSLGCTTPLFTVPFGLDVSKYPFEASYDFRPSLFHIGAMDWKPNIEGVDWFLSEAWPKIRKEYSKLTFHLAGKASVDYRPKHPAQGIILEGELPNAKRFMMEHGIMVVPLFSSGGIRVKIIEAMALGKMVITTSIGAQGLEVADGEHLLIADDADAFLQRIRDIHEQPELCERISRQARKQVQQHYDQSVMSHRLSNFYKELLPSTLQKSRS